MEMWPAFARCATAISSVYVSSASHLKEGIRNLQIAITDGIYIFHGRNAAMTSFVLYSSENGFEWDEGCYLARENGVCYYSNSIVLKNQNDRKRLLIRYSKCYGVHHCVNVKHMWLCLHKKIDWQKHRQALQVAVFVFLF